jgi:hypothetical protein
MINPAVQMANGDLRVISARCCSKIGALRRDAVG